MKPVYRMSESGSCKRVLGATRLGYEPLPTPAWLERIFREGKRHEDWVVEDLVAKGYDIERGGICLKCLEDSGYEREGIHIELEFPLFILMGHLDGRAKLNGKRHPLEIKALGRFTFEKFKKKGIAVFRDYAAQETCYMSAEGENTWPGLYSVKCRDTGEILNEPWLEFSTPPLVLDWVVDHISEVEINARLGELPEGEFEEGSEQCRGCRFSYLCIRKAELLGGKQPVVDEELINAAEMWREGHEYEKLASERLEPAKKVIRKYLESNKLKEIPVAGIIAKLIDKERKGWNEDYLMKLLPPRVFAEARKVTPYTELRIKEAGEDESNAG